MHRSLGNPLIRRVQRHASLATLFRSAVTYDLPATRSPALPAFYPGPVVGATLALAEPVAPVPEAGLQPGQETVEPIRAAQSILPVTPVQSEITGTRRIQSAQPGKVTPVPVTPPPVQRSTVPPSPAASARPAPEKPKDEEEDKVWRRLQTIFRRHQEKQVEEQQAAPEATETGTGVQTAAESGGPAAANRRPPTVPPLREALQAKPASPAPRPLPVQKAPTSRWAEVVEQVASQPSVERPASQPRPAEAEGSPQPATEPERPAKASQPAPVAPERVAVVEEPLAAGETAVIRKPAEKMDAAGGVEATQVLRPAEQRPKLDQALPETAEKASINEREQPPAQAPGRLLPAVRRAEEQVSSPASDRPVPSRLAGEPPTLAVEAGDLLAPSPAALGTEGLGGDEYRPVPLEAVWPVQRLEAPETSVASQPPGLRTEAGREVQAAMPEERQETQALRPEEGPQVRHLLKEVEPGQPTDSSVELILPRRPRPEVLTSPQPVEPGPPAEGSERAEAALQMHLQETLPAESPDQTVKTEIGPLPADLWRLIGQKPPEPAGETGLTAPGGPAVMATPSLPEAQGILPPRLPQATGPALEEPARQNEGSPRLVSQPAGAQPVVSRAVSIGEIEATPGSPETAASRPEQEGGVEVAGRGSEVDMEELAARVYSEVKRRLSVEWERLRRKF